MSDDLLDVPLKEITFDTPMPWGKHRGKRTGDISMNYFLTLYRQEFLKTFDPRMYKFIKKHKREWELHLEALFDRYVDEQDWMWRHDE